jgi:L-cystine transport system permease protein
MIDLGYFWTCLKAAVSYIPQNLFMSLCTLVICILLGTVIALARVFRVPVAKQVFDVVIALCKAFPANLVLLIVYLLVTNNFAAIMAFFHLDISIQDLNMTVVAIAALVICCLSGISEVIRGGLQAIDKGQYEAGEAMGITWMQTFLHIIVPQVVRTVVPPLTNSILSLLKATALVSVIGVVDIMNGALIAANQSYSYLEAYVAATLVFWVFGLLLERLSKAVERYFGKSVKTLAA